jgi:transcription antitermination factor NusG
MGRKIQKTSKMKAQHVLLLEAARQEAQKWREGRRAMLAKIPTGLVWFVAVVRPGKEAKALKALNDAGFWAYCPVERVTIKSRLGRRDLARPLFPRYMFISRKAGSATIEGVQEISDVLGRQSGEWSAVPDGLIRALIDSEGLGVFDRTEATVAVVRKRRLKKLSTGDTVKVADGPLAGFPAKIISIDAQERIRALVSIFGRETSVEGGIDNFEVAA